MNAVTSRRETDPRAWGGVHVLADDDPRWQRDPVAQARAACAGGAAVVQLRVKHATDGRALEWARAIRRVCNDAGARFVVNDRFDLALAAGADGVHLGQEDLPPRAVPDWVRERLGIGRSTHTLAQARCAASEPVDYVAIGPVFGTTSKETGYEARGLELVEQVVACADPLPVIAIGGIASANLEAVVRAGAAGAAVISTVAAADDPVRATRELAARFDDLVARSREGARS